MSLVGPRPERPELQKEIEKEVPEFGLRLQAKAGLTGYAQVYGKYNTTFYDKLLMDLMYISKPSILEDLTIMLATVKILTSKESTEPCYYFQKLEDMFVFTGQRGELAICINSDLEHWYQEHLSAYLQIKQHIQSMQWEFQKL